MALQPEISVTLSLCSGCDYYSQFKAATVRHIRAKCPTAHVITETHKFLTGSSLRPNDAPPVFKMEYMTDGTLDKAIVEAVLDTPVFRQVVFDPDDWQYVAALFKHTLGSLGPPSLRFFKVAGNNVTFRTENNNFVKVSLKRMVVQVHAWLLRVLDNAIDTKEVEFPTGSLDQRLCLARKQDFGETSEFYKAVGNRLYGDQFIGVPGHIRQKIQTSELNLQTQFINLT